MSKQEDIGRPEKPLEKMREIDDEARISKKAEMNRKSNRNQKQITLWDKEKTLWNFPEQLLMHASFSGDALAQPYQNNKYFVHWRSNIFYTELFWSKFHGKIGEKFLKKCPW